MIKPMQCTYEEFQESTTAAEGMKVLIPNEERISCGVALNVEYAVKGHTHLHLHIIGPTTYRYRERKFPLIMYVQGSAWFPQCLESELAQLCRFASRGYVIAIVEYRPASVAPFPAQIMDAKTAIQFMRENAETYLADPDNIVMWGDSSGGHTAVMTNVTLDNQEYSEEAIKEHPLNVKAFVDFYGPTDIAKMNEDPSIQDHIEPNSPEGMLIGGRNVLENLDLAAKTCPMNYISADKKLKPLLIMHGSKDRLVPFRQSVLLYEKLKEEGQEVEFYQLKGADHGGAAFWSEEVLDIVEEFLLRYIQK